MKRFSKSGSSRLVLERLETRNLLSGSPLSIVLPSADYAASAAVSSASTNRPSTNPAVTNPTVVGNIPSTIRNVYDFNQLTTFATATGTELADGAGQTIAIVDAYNDPNIASDMAVFDSTFGIAPPPSLTVVSQTGSTTRLPTTNAAWDVETALDVEWAHAIAPGAKILLVEATSDRWSDLLAGVTYAKNQPGVSVVSMSWGSSEYRVENVTDATFTSTAGHPVTFVTAAGDDGSPPSYPATSPNVLAVGGTTLNITAGGGYGSENAWSDGGGGVSMFEREPAFQEGAQNTGYRSGVDVAYDADPNTGFAVYDTVNAGYGTGWIEIGGTSAGTPQWSALLAIADEGLAAAGKPALANAQARLYSLPANAFHDITSGNNGTYAAGPGYDAVTGLGTPVANVLIADLVNGVTGSPTGVSHLTPITAHANGQTTGSASRDVMIQISSLPWPLPPTSGVVLKSSGNADTPAVFRNVGNVDATADLPVVANQPQALRWSGGDVQSDLLSEFFDGDDWLSDSQTGDAGMPNDGVSDQSPQSPATSDDLNRADAGAQLLETLDLSALSTSG